MLITDGQIHIWGAESSRRPWPADHGVPHRPSMTAEEVLAEIDAAGVARAVIVPPSWEGDRNDLALQAARDHPHRFAVMGRIDVTVPFSVDLERWRDAPGMLGIRMAHRQLFVDGVGDWFWPEAARAHLPVMVSAAGKTEAIARVAEAFPQLRLIIDHMNLRVGITREEIAPSIDALLLMSRLPNIAVKVSAYPSRVDEAYPFPSFRPILERLLDAFGAHRCMWGSDLTVLPCPYLDWVRAITEADFLSSADKVMLMGETLSSWLNWPAG